MRVNVFEEDSESVIWYKVIARFIQNLENNAATHLYLFKERFLGDDEIVENLVVSILLHTINNMIS